MKGEGKKPSRSGSTRPDMAAPPAVGSNAPSPPAPRSPLESGEAAPVSRWGPTPASEPTPGSGGGPSSEGKSSTRAGMVAPPAPGSMRPEGDRQRVSSERQTMQGAVGPEPKIKTLLSAKYEEEEPLQEAPLPPGTEGSDELPTDPENSPPSLGQLGPQSEKPTVPGGGMNRVSGGRTAAAAYVGVQTVPPGRSTPLPTARIKLDESVVKAHREHRTERAIRAPFSEPPAPESTRSSVFPARPRQVMALVAVLALAVGALAAVIVVSPDAEEEQIVWDNGIDGHPAVLEEPDARKVRNDAPERPKQEGRPLAQPFAPSPERPTPSTPPRTSEEPSLAQAPAPPTDAALPKEAAPPREVAPAPQQPPPSKVKKTVPSRAVQPTSDPNNDPWLE